MKYEGIVVEKSWIPPRTLKIQLVGVNGKIEIPADMIKAGKGDKIFLEIEVSNNDK